MLAAANALDRFVVNMISHPSATKHTAPPKRDPPKARSVVLPSRDFRAMKYRPTPAMIKAANPMNTNATTPEMRPTFAAVSYAPCKTLDAITLATIFLMGAGILPSHETTRAPHSRCIGHFAIKWPMHFAIKWPMHFAIKWPMHLQSTPARRTDHWLVWPGYVPAGQSKMLFTAYQLNFLARETRHRPNAMANAAITIRPAPMLRSLRLFFGSGFLRTMKYTPTQAEMVHTPTTNQYMTTLYARPNFTSISYAESITPTAIPLASGKKIHRRVMKRTSTHEQLPHNLVAKIYGMAHPHNQAGMRAALPNVRKNNVLKPPVRDYTRGTGLHQKLWNECEKKIKNLLVSVYGDAFDQKAITVEAWAMQKESPAVHRFTVEADTLLRTLRLAKAAYANPKVNNAEFKDLAYGSKSGTPDLPTTRNAIMNDVLLIAKAWYDRYAAKGLVPPSEWVEQGRADDKRRSRMHWDWVSHIGRQQRAETRAAKTIQTAWRKHRNAKSALRANSTRPGRQLIPGKGAPFAVLRGPSNDRRSVNQRAAAAARHTSVAGWHLRPDIGYRSRNG